MPEPTSIHPEWRLDVREIQLRRQAILGEIAREGTVAPHAVGLEKLHDRMLLAAIEEGGQDES